MPRTALLLIAHGSRNADANADLFALVEILKSLGQYEVVEPAFLELAEPGLEAGAGLCLAQDAGRVILVPYFLSAGVHVRRDLQNFRDRLARQHPGVEFILAEPLGRHPLVAKIIGERVQEALEKQGRGDK